MLVEDLSSREDTFTRTNFQNFYENQLKPTRVSPDQR